MTRHEGIRMETCSEEDRSSDKYEKAGDNKMKVMEESLRSKRDFNFKMDIHNYTGLPQETRKIPKGHFNCTTKGTRRRKK